MQESAAAPIGVFDSGVGGLTVLAALRRELPRERFLYLGDTARLPYGTKSPETVVRYALQASEAIVARGVKALVIACNTASAAALPAIRERFPSLPIIGVIEPGAKAACAATRSGHVAVLATEGTVRGGAYQEAIERCRPGTRVDSVPCQLFVALAEEGWTTGDVAVAVAQRYVSPLFGTSEAGRVDTLVLGCTHFPMLIAPIRAVAGPNVEIVDSAATTALATRDALQERGLLQAAGRAPDVQFLATDGAERFARVGSLFLGQPLYARDVTLVDL